MIAIGIHETSRFTLDQGLVISSGEVLQQHSVEEDVAAADLAEQDALSGIIQELDVMPRSQAVADEEKAEGEVPEAR